MSQPGRPSTYTPELAVEICKRLAEGESLRSICRDDAMPARSTVVDWVLTNREGFSAQYTQARDLGLDNIADEVFEISDDGSNDWMEKHGKDGEVIGWQINGEALGRSRLRFDARRWYLSKLAPKRYGDKAEVALTGANGGPIEIDQTTRSARLAGVVARLKARQNQPGDAPDDGSDLA